MILLDTSALIRWVCIPEKLSKKARRIIGEAFGKEEIFISSMTVWEISLLIRKDRLGFFLDEDTWLEKVESLPFITFIPVDNRIAVKSVNLHDFRHKDPADRIIVATALTLGAKLVTSDRRLLTYPHVQTVW